MENHQLGCIALVMVSIVSFTFFISQYGIGNCRIQTYSNFLAAYKRVPTAAERISLDKQCDREDNPESEEIF